MKKSEYTLLLPLSLGMLSLDVASYQAAYPHESEHLEQLPDLSIRPKPNSQNKKKYSAM